MSQYKILALKWRPQTLEEVVGHSNLVKALANSFDSGMLHHAYLFSGTRGAGKTTLARIIAKCFNCESGVSSRPCNSCNSCVSITNMENSDVVEIDAASRTKVEDTKEILDTVPYLPSSSRYKVFIIDEVHMLSSHSFNALLKTLENPPEHVKFILATTDVHKLPITVVSRCLQFNLKPFKLFEIENRLAHILKEEHIPYEENSLTYIADAATGSMRDALMLLEQVIAYSNKNVTSTIVAEILSIPNESLIKDLVNHIVRKDIKQALNICRQFSADGVSVASIFDMVLKRFHKLLESKLVDVSADNSIHTITVTRVQVICQIFLKMQSYLSSSRSTYVLLELAVMQAINFFPVLEKSANIRDKVHTNDSTEHSSVEKTLSEAKTNDEAKPKDTEYKLEPEVDVAVTSSSNTQQSLDNLQKKWCDVLSKVNLSSMVAQFALNTSVESWSNEGLIKLNLSEEHRPLYSKRAIARLEEVLSKYLKYEVKISINIAKSVTITPKVVNEEKKIANQDNTKKEILEDKSFTSSLEKLNGKFIDIEFDE